MGRGYRGSWGVIVVVLCLGWLGVVSEPSHGGEGAGEGARGGGEFGVRTVALTLSASVARIEVGARGGACPCGTTTKTGGEGGAKKVEGMGTRGEYGVCECRMEKGGKSIGETRECGAEDGGPTGKGSGEEEKYRENCRKEGGARRASNV